MPDDPTSLSNQSGFKEVLPHLEGRTINGYATTAIDGELVGLALTFEGKSWAQITMPYDGGSFRIAFHDDLVAEREAR